MTKIDQTALQNLLQLIGGDKPSLVALIESFLTEGPVLVETLLSAQTDHDLESIRRAAHTLKSSARDFGAMELGSCCATLEAQCKANQVIDIDHQVSQISSEFNAIRNELQTFAAELV